MQKSIFTKIKPLIPQYLKNMYRYLKVKHKFPGLEITPETRLDLNRLDSYTFESGVSILSADVGAGCSMGRNSYIRANSSIGSSPEVPTRIGRYCSISSNVSFINADHTLNTASTSPKVFADRSEYTKLRKHGAITIGSDVWICTNAIITKGVTVGHGAVIGAGAVVTKDVEPYTLVAGVPAKTIRKRFSDKTISSLVNTKWWEWSEEKILNSNAFFVSA